MRKQTKIAAVVSAAALLALGASITSFAAAKGTWMMVDGEWYCYDKNGDVYENTFCSSNGKEYYVGEDGAIVRSQWVEYDGSYYFVNSSGAKVTSDWRLTAPYDDEDAEEEWYYFQSTGKRAENKKILYKGKTYYFDSEGKMITGWVTYDSEGTASVDEANDFVAKKTFYADETGARIEKDWVYTTAPGTDDDDADADEYWYYLKSNGEVQTGKAANVKGQTFLFNAVGQMQTGWVAYTESEYKSVDGEDSDFVIADGETVYWCPEGGDFDGHVKKNQWIKAWRPADTYEEDEDVDKYYYWLEKDGKVYIPSEADATGHKYDFKEGELVEKAEVEITKKKIASKNYFFNQNGEMLSKFVCVEAGELENGMYYFGGSDDGSMKTGSQSIKDDMGDVYKFYFGTKTTSGYDAKGVGITGNKNGKLYELGKLVTAEDYKYEIVTVEGHDFIVNQNGSIQYSKVVYKEDGEELIDATGFEFEKEGTQWKNSIK